MPDDPLTPRADEIKQKLDAIPHLRVRDAQELYQQEPDAGRRILELELDKVRLELELEKASRKIERMQQPKWLQPAGICFGAFTLLFFMLIVLLGIVGYVVPPPTKFALVAVLALGSAFSAAAWIGSITLSGDIASPNSQKPLVVSAAGGFATFIIVFALGFALYIK